MTIRGNPIPDRATGAYAKDGILVDGSVPYPQNAIDDAAADATASIVLGPGEFDGFTIQNDKIDVFGTGESTLINGRIRTTGDECRISQLAVSNPGGTGVLCDNSPSDPVVTRVIILASDVGIELNGTGGLLWGCNIEEATTDGILAGGRKHRIEGNMVGENTQRNIGDDGMQVSSRETIVALNHVVGTDDDGIVVNGDDCQILVNNLDDVNVGVDVNGSDDQVGWNRIKSRTADLDTSGSTTPELEHNT